MPQAVMHILLVLIAVDLYRDYFIKNKKKFPLHYVLIAGVAGILPDFDYILFWIFGLFGYSTAGIHRTFTHTLFFPLIFLILFFLTMNAKAKIKGKWLGEHHLKWHIIFLMIFIGTAVHLGLDAVFSGAIMPLYPLSTMQIGLNLFGLLPGALASLAAPTADAAILILWLIHEEWRHKLSHFI